MKIGILGTRGIPNQYGGFEQFAQYLATGLTSMGHEVLVYCSSTHSYQKAEWNNVQLAHIYDPEPVLGTFGQFVYDFLSILDSRNHDFDLILQLGYTSSSIFFNIHSNTSLLVTNMDGLEWKRTKYNKLVRKFLLWAENRAVRTSDCLVSDSKGIAAYLKDTYDATSIYIPYGANLFNNSNKKYLADYNVAPHQYNMLIARMEPENSIEMILDGVAAIRDEKPFIVIGSIDNRYGRYLARKFSKTSNIRFIGGIYDIESLNNLRHYSNLYFHGHTVGGTNPSLLEAMASNALICAHRNTFNSFILKKDAFYFSSDSDVSYILQNVDRSEHQHKICRNRKKITKFYSWKRIVKQYEELFRQMIANR